MLSSWRYAYPVSVLLLTALEFHFHKYVKDLQTIAGMIEYFSVK